MRVILRRTPNHRWPTNVNQFNRRFCRERIEVCNDKIDRFDAVLLHIGAMFGVSRVGKNAAVNFRMQRDNSMAEDRRESSEISNISDGDSGFGNDTRGAAT